MPFCRYCGQELRSDAAFCIRCGKPVVLPENGFHQRSQVYEGNIHKCPNCGESVSAFEIKCPSCGYEFRGVQSSSISKEFAMRIQEIENSEHAEPKKSFWSSSNEIDVITQKKITLIRNYPIPNTREDVLEFFFLAVSNIDVDLYHNNPNSKERSVSDAWMAKAEQIYQKAIVSFGADPEIERIKSIYNSKMEEVRNSKKKNGYVLILGLFLMLV